MLKFFQKASETFPDMIRRRLTGVDTLPQLALLGLLSGILTGGVILLFRFLVEWPLAHLLPGGNTEAFEQLDLLTRSLIPLAGALMLGLLLHRVASHLRRVGVVHVMERLNYHQGYIPFRSALMQFAVGMITLMTGQSAGREGPAVHLGAAFSSLMGQWMRLPNTSIRTLVACGCAGAISASFNTPIAGVIFAMEVVMMEYTIAGFTPIILAAVSAAVVSQAVYGSEPAFDVPVLMLNSLVELPFIVGTAIVIGIAAASFIHLIQWASRFNERPVLLRMTAAGLVMVPFAIAIPEVMGIGYDTVSATITDRLPLYLLVGVGIAKLVVTALTIGLGMPSGLIGPTIFIGATLGGAMGIVGEYLMPQQASSMGLYAVLGMGAMMGAVLQAPLAALMAVIELTRNSHMILPAMLIITVASLVTSEVFGKRSVFHFMLQVQGLKYQNSPVVQALRRTSVINIMDKNFLRTQRHLTIAEADLLLKSQPKWLLVDGSKGPITLMPASDLVRFLETQREKAAEGLKEMPEQIDLVEVPANRRDVAPVTYQATLEEALQTFDSHQAQALYVQMPMARSIQRIYGVVLQSDIESHYQYQRV